MAKFTTPLFGLEAPPAVIAFGIAVGVGGLVAKAYFRTQRYNTYVFAKMSEEEALYDAKTT